MKSCAPSPTSSTVVSPVRTWAWLAIGLVAWGIAYTSLHTLSQAIVTFFKLPPHAPFTHAFAFFLYDTPKVLLLLSLVVFVMTTLRTFIPMAKVRSLLAGRRQGIGNVAAATLGIVTPFCSCSAVSMFVGFISAGVPLGITFSFLISAPMINEIALGLLWAMLGWKVALAYLLFGLIIAIGAGAIIGHLHLEHWLQPWVRQQRTMAHTQLSDVHLMWPQRLHMGWQGVKSIVGSTWLWVVLGIAVGAAIHGYVPPQALSALMGGTSWWSVPAAVAIGAPIYTNAAGVIPIVQVLLQKGAALGTVLAFMMSVVALSLPEMVILHKVLTLRFIGLFVGIVTTGILCVGYLFNAIFA